MGFYRHYLPNLNKNTCNKYMTSTMHTYPRLYTTNIESSQSSGQHAQQSKLLEDTETCQSRRDSTKYQVPKSMSSQSNKAGICKQQRKQPTTIKQYYIIQAITTSTKNTTMRYKTIIQILQGIHNINQFNKRSKHMSAESTASPPRNTFDSSMSPLY